MTRTLHQFALSHYCDKVRWALDHKRLEYQVHDYAPGEHMIAIRRLTPGSSTLPVLCDGAKILRNSSDILTHLDETYPEATLTPHDVDLRKDALEWERWADKHIGPHVRRVLYFRLFQDTERALDRLTQGLPPTKRRLMTLAFPILRASMKRGMRIYPEPVARSEQALITHIAELNAHMQGRDFTVGDALTRADVAITALLHPMLVDEHGNKPSSLLSPELDRAVRTLDWADALYETHRHT